MRKLLILCGAILFLSMTAAAQETIAALETSGSPASEPAPAAPASLTPPDREAWQLGVGFQYQHYTVLGQNFHTFGYNTDLTRYLNNWFGVEGTGSFGFGKDNGLTTKSFFVGGGPHIALFST
ncbi:MAG: hypothetical protein ACRD4Y_03235, partial [Candidatus Acidiferrales bacterium]